MNAKRKLRRSLNIRRSNLISNIFLFLSITFDILVFALILPDSRVASWYMKILPSYNTVQYRGATITYPKDMFSKEKLKVFYTVVDSLTDDVNPEYSIGNVPMNVYVNRMTLESLFESHLAGTAVSTSKSIFLKPCTYNGELNDGDLAMILIHEYVHIVQYTSPSFLRNYEDKIGWNKPESERSENFFSVMSNYSFKSSSEDMSDSYMFPYLCGNTLFLSPERLEEALGFWNVPREEFCRNFN